MSEIDLHKKRNVALAKLVSYFLIVVMLFAVYAFSIVPTLSILVFLAALGILIGTWREALR